MLNHPTRNLMHSLGFEGMAKGFKELQNDPESQALDHQEWLRLLLGYEATSRQQKRVERRLRAAKLRQAASVEGVDYRASRGLDRGLFQKLATNDWIRDRCNLLITVLAASARATWPARSATKPAGTTSPSSTIGRHDCSQCSLWRVAMTICTRAPIDRQNRTSHHRRLGACPPNADQRRDLLEIVEDRYDAGSILIASQLPIENWHDIIGDSTIADAILDRIVRNAYRIELSGESLRKTRSQNGQA